MRINPAVFRVPSDRDVFAVRVNIAEKCEELDELVQIGLCASSALSALHCGAPGGRRAHRLGGEADRPSRPRAPSENPGRKRRWVWINPNIIPRAQPGEYGLFKVGVAFLASKSGESLDA